MGISGVTLVAASKTGCFAFTSNVAANDTVRVGNVLYTFKATPSAAFEVDVGVDLDTSISNLVAAINLSGTEGTTYGTGTTRHPYVTATADLPNDEIDLVARIPGDVFQHIALAASSPGANDISPGGATLGAVAGGTAGSGDLSSFAQGILDNAQIQSDLIAEMRGLTTASD